MNSSSQGCTLPRLLPEEPLPPYAFVPGRSPHPTADPAGHSYGRVPPNPGAVDPEHWSSSRAYLRGIDLFNHGYYWEAHEAWEGLWNACGRAGLTASFLKALIKLAAAGVKVRQGRPEGVRSHARRAAELFRQVAGRQGTEAASYLGLPLAGLQAFAEALASAREMPTANSGAPVEVVFDFILRPVPAPG